MSDYTGEGLPEHQVEACACINLAALQGDETAWEAANLPRQKLSPVELYKAETRAMELISKY
ncbi:MAG: hypothetical protein OXH03_12185 [Bacteroidetes bacterium]|nr:hypothetical protein [Bacteroidota bacterium]MDE2672517.1 hypothetical protein [Bacteroidota bacterium]